MTEKKRTCRTCAWWGNIESDPDRVPGTQYCHYDCNGHKYPEDWWCRHWSETTGWDRFEEMPTELEKQAAEIFQKASFQDWIPVKSPLADDAGRWLEEYRRKC